MKEDFLENSSSDVCMKDMINIVNILKRRGFLLEESGKKIYLSDNAHPDDSKYLSDILTEFGIGYLQGNQIIINSNNNQDMLKSLFHPVRQGIIGTGSNNRTHPIRYLKAHDCADKIPVRFLEPNIAYYIKALSACGIFTGGCCDGNHPGCGLLYIEFDSPLYQEFHEALWKCFLSELFFLKWRNHFTSIDLSEEREEQYHNLYLAADYMYRNRFFFRRIRKESAAWINRNTEKNMQIDLIKDRFIKEVKMQLQIAKEILVFESD